MNQSLSPLWLSLLFAFCQLECLAQDDKIFLVSLDKEKIELTYFPYKFKEIIDNRYNKITIGNVQRGMFKSAGQPLLNRICKARFTICLLTLS